jgi:hypothetical protein
MSTNFQNLTSEDLKMLDILIDNDWIPILNLLPSGWHVALIHKCVPTPEMVLVEHEWVHVNRSPYNIHGHGETLTEALGSAVRQVRDLITPV